jgi:hypothetical protein
MENTCKTPEKSKNLKEFLTSRNFLKPLSGVLGGALLGFLYYHFIGCSSGSCFITGHSYSSVIFGGFSGYMLTSGPCTKC